MRGMNARKYIISGLLLAACYQPCLNAADADILWNKALGHAKEGEIDFAFMNFQMLIDTYPDFRNKSAAMFSLGEYYFAQHNFSAAVKEFEHLYDAYPKSREALFSLSYLYKIALAQGRGDVAQEYQRKMIAAHAVVFIFKDKESLEYRSGFQHKYNFIFYIDRIQVLMDGELFIEVHG